MSLLYHVNMYLEFLILACTIYILAPQLAGDEGVEPFKQFKPEFFDLILIDDERVIIRTKLEKPSKIKGLALI